MTRLVIDEAFPLRDIDTMMMLMLGILLIGKHTYLVDPANGKESYQTCLMVAIKMQSIITFGIMQRCQPSLFNREVSYFCNHFCPF